MNFIKNQQCHTVVVSAHSIMSYSMHPNISIWVKKMHEIIFVDAPKCSNVEKGMHCKCCNSAHSLAHDRGQRHTIANSVTIIMIPSGMPSISIHECHHKDEVEIKIKIIKDAASSPFSDCFRSALILALAV